MAGLTSLSEFKDERGINFSREIGASILYFRMALAELIIAVEA